jgi:hypothetical protein
MPPASQSLGQRNTVKVRRFWDMHIGVSSEVRQFLQYDNDSTYRIAQGADRLFARSANPISSNASARLACKVGVRGARKIGPCRVLGIGRGSRIDTVLK